MLHIALSDLAAMFQLRHGCAGYVAGLYGYVLTSMRNIAVMPVSSQPRLSDPTHMSCLCPAAESRGHISARLCDGGALQPCTPTHLGTGAACLSDQSVGPMQGVSGLNRSAATEDILTDPKYVALALSGCSCSSHLDAAWLIISHAALC